MRVSKKVLYETPYAVTGGIKHRVYEKEMLFEMGRRVKGNFHARCQAGGKSGDYIKGLPIAIILWDAMAQEFVRIE